MVSKILTKWWNSDVSDVISDTRCQDYFSMFSHLLSATKKITKVGLKFSEILKIP